MENKLQIVILNDSLRLSDSYMICNVVRNMTNTDTILFILVANALNSHKR